MDIGYSLPPDTSELDRPSDFNEFRRFTQSKEYLGLIYADANNMGMAIENLPRLLDIYKVANAVDENIYRAMSRAIKEHLPIVEVKKDEKIISLFPFDILLLGGDDIVMVTDASKAMDIALTIAQEFRSLTDEMYTLSIGIALTPVKYPFSLVRAIAESALKFAKSESVKARAQGELDDTRINFLTVTGGSVNDFKEVFHGTYHKKNNVELYDDKGEFYATLRPYKVQDLDTLLNEIREAKKLRLGRTKLHQLREAVLDKNLTTSVTKGLELLSNWREKERTFVARRVYEFGGRSPQQGNSQRDQAVLDFPRVTFPWFVYGKNEDGQRVYRTPLLDFIELYDFVVAREGETGGNGE
jgi:CRISPR-associated protein Cmr2